MKMLLILKLILVSAFVYGCFNEPEHVIKKKLNIILADDLAFMKNELPSGETLDSCYYDIEEFKHFPKDVKFSYKAVVAFYYFKDIQMKQVRKYRYQMLQKKWDRYLKEYKNI